MLKCYRPYDTSSNYVTITIDIHIAPRWFEHIQVVLVLVYYIAACSYTEYSNI